MALNTKIKPLKFKNHVLNIYLNLIKLQLDQAQLLMIILKYQDVFLRNSVPGSKSYAQATVPSNSSRTSSNVVIFWNSIVNLSTKLKYNINIALANVRARFKYFAGATSKELSRYQESSRYQVFFIWFEVRFLTFATNKANYDWLTLILNMVGSNQNNTKTKP